MSPFFSGGNHFTAAGVAAAYPSPNPVPARSPNPSTAGRTDEGVAKLATMSPAPVRTPPSDATSRGPSLSCSRPAGIIMSAKQAIASVYGSVACVFVQPKPPRAIGSTSCFEKTDHAYRIPSARFSPMPASVTIHPLRFMPVPPAARRRECSARAARIAAGD